jgi:CubicO group peptidase (beta-lactamase class C family)
MKLRASLCLLLSSTVTTLLGCATQAPPPQLSAGQEQEAIDHLSRFINHEMQQAHAQGLSIAIVSDQTIVWEKGFGWANKEMQRPANAQTLYRTGSISKLLTDLGALQLAASGRLNLDTPVREVLLDFAPVAPDGKAYPITPRMLMTHHSGLPRDVLKGFMSSQPAPFSDVIKQLNAMGADDIPMRSFSYSNAGISVLGAVVAETSGQPFASWMRDSVLGPLEMSESAFEAQPSQSKNMAQGYTKGQPATEPGLRDVPAGGLTSSVHDMSNFMRMVFADGRFKDKQVLPNQWVKSMLSPQNTQSPLDAGFQVGLGWMLGSLNAGVPRGVGTVAHHAGSTRLFNSQMYVLPEQKIGVIVMSNDQGARELVDRVALRALNVQLQVKLGHRTEPVQASPWASARREDAASRQEATVERWAGLYSTAVGPVRISHTPSDAPKAKAFGKTFTLRLRESGARSPMLSLMGLVPVELGSLSQLEFTRQDINGVQAITARLGDQTMLLGSRIPETTLPKTWQQRVGAYRLVNQGDDAIAITDLKIRQEGNHLMLSYIDLDAGPDPQELVLLPLSDTSAQVLSLLPDAGPRIQVMKASGKEQLSFSGFLAERQSP